MRGSLEKSIRQTFHFNEPNSDSSFLSTCFRARRESAIIFAAAAFVQLFEKNFLLKKNGINFAPFSSPRLQIKRFKS